MICLLEHIQVIGSPFEADAQCSHLVRLGLADAVATTDADIYTFRCPLTLYGHLTQSKKVGAMVRLGQTCSKEINAMTAREVVWLTCLCGCDYIDNLHGYGMAKALATVKSWRDKPEGVRCTNLCDLCVYPMFTFTLLPLPPQYRQRCLHDMEEIGKWPKTANQELFHTRAHGANGFTARFNLLAAAAFMAHRVSLYR